MYSKKQMRSLQKINREAVVMGRTININEVNEHLNKLDGRTGDIELYRHIMSKDEESGDVWGRSYSVDSGIGSIIGQLDEGHQQYITLALFSSPTRRTKSTIRATSGLYVDLDDSLFKGGGRIALYLINKTLTRARIPHPTLTINTGGGWHLYWLFSDIYYINTEEDIRRYESVITSIIESLSIIGADPKAKDVTRLLRLAGTYNHKYTLSPAVMILESSELYYDLGDFNGLHVVKKLPREYDLPVKKEVKKSILTTDEPTAINQSSKTSQVINQPLTRPDEAFPWHLIGDIIIDAQDVLEKRNKTARFMDDINQSILVDLLINYVNLPRNTYTFEDGTAGQYILEGHRNHFIWSLARRGVTDNHLSIINNTLLLPSLNHKEFMNALKVGRTMGIPKIKAMINDLGLSLAEQSTMVALRVDYEVALDKHEKTITTRINQLISESHQQYILASKGKSSKELADELGISVRWVNRVRKQKGGDFMSRAERIQEVRNMFRDVESTGRVALDEIYENYIIAGQALDKIIHNQGLIHSLRVQLTEQQKEDIITMAESIIAKVEVITSQLDSYEEFLLDESEYFKSGKIKKTVLLEKVNKLKASVELITV